ncbi:MAG: YbaB/EbfC family nucleoid-associated protein [Halanaerobiales bacterium]
MDINNIIEQIGIIKEELGRLEKELETISVEGTDDNKIITAIVSGKGRVLDYQFNIGEMAGLKKDTLVKAVVDATNNSLQAVEDLKIARKKEIIGDVNMPDMPGLF